MAQVNSSRVHKILEFCPCKYELILIYISFFDWKIEVLILYRRLKNFISRSLTTYWQNSIDLAHILLYTNSIVSILLVDLCIKEYEQSCECMEDST